MESRLTKLAPMTTADPPTLVASLPAGFFERAFSACAHCVGLLWRSAIRSAGSRRKTLVVGETAALGDRRFVSVIQFGRQRFLIGSSPSSITLLSRLSDDGGSGELGVSEESRGSN
jgi:hypothetical protein